MGCLRQDRECRNRHRALLINRKEGIPHLTTSQWMSRAQRSGTIHNIPNPGSMPKSLLTTRLHLGAVVCIPRDLQVLTPLCRCPVQSGQALLCQFRMLLPHSNQNPHFSKSSLLSSLVRRAAWPELPILRQIFLDKRLRRMNRLGQVQHDQRQALLVSLSLTSSFLQSE